MKLKLKKGQRSWKMWAIVTKNGTMIDVFRTKIQAKMNLYTSSEVVKKVIVIEDE